MRGNIKDILLDPVSLGHLSSGEKRKIVKDGVNEDGAKVLGEEHGSPRDLRAY